MDGETIAVTLAFAIPFVAGLIRPLIFRETMKHVKRLLIWIVKFLYWFIRQFFLAIGDFFMSWWERLKQGPDY